MMNQVILVARINDIEPAEEYGTDSKTVILKSPNQFKNDEGVYEDNLFDVVLKGNIATNTMEYCTKGDIIGIKGHLESFKYSKGSKNFRRTIIVADKVTFLSSHSSEVMNNEI